MRKKIIVTTSWDDGHKLDLRLAKLLKKYNLKGTFYIAPKNREFPKRELLSDKEIVKLSKDFEIGAHTMNHYLLPNDFQTFLFKYLMKLMVSVRGGSYSIPRAISLNEAKYEIESSKIYLEKLFHKKIISFCYPAGRTNKSTENLVKDSGFLYARTVERHNFNIPENFLKSPTSIHALTQYQDILKIATFSNFNPVKIIENLNWDILAKRSFDKVKEGGVFHFWGHSWLIDSNNDWSKLESVFSYISNREDARYMENGELVSVEI